MDLNSILIKIWLFEILIICLYTLYEQESMMLESSSHSNNPYSFDMCNSILI
jgi:hypothetical protein